MVDDGKNFTAPMLNKREPIRHPLLWCDTCNKAIRSPAGEHSSGGSYILYEGGAGDPPMVFTVSCHGESSSLGIEDVPGFYQSMEKHRAPKEFTTQQGGEWWHVFPKADASGVKDDPTTL